jgi:hypothetical protein
LPGEIEGLLGRQRSNTFGWLIVRASRTSLVNRCTSQWRAADAEQLDCNGLSQLQVLGTIGLAHCSSPEQIHDAIAGRKDVSRRKARIVEWAVLDQRTVRIAGRLRGRELRRRCGRDLRLALRSHKALYVRG